MHNRPQGAAGAHPSKQDGGFNSTIPASATGVKKCATAHEGRFAAHPSKQDGGVNYHPTLIPPSRQPALRPRYPQAYTAPMSPLPAPDTSPPTVSALPSAPLEGIRVVEWGELVSAPFCARLLAEMGADVVKVEPPDGDPARRRGPYPDAVPHPERSGRFLFANQGKRGVTLDTATDDGIAQLHRLLATADVFVENRPRVAQLSADQVVR